VRNLDDEVIVRLKRRAARHGRSAEAEVRAILANAVASEPKMADFERLSAEMRRLTAGRVHTPSEVLQREGRDER
jgi:plasmid stability protein